MVSCVNIDQDLDMLIFLIDESPEPFLDHFVHADFASDHWRWLDFVCKSQCISEIDLSQETMTYPKQSPQSQHENLRHRTPRLQ